MIRKSLTILGIVAVMSPCLLAANEATMEPSTYQQIAACLFVGCQPVPGEIVYFLALPDNGKHWGS